MCIYVSPEEARPGELILFGKTYDTDGASHPCTPVEAVLQDIRWVFKVASLQ